MEIQDIKQGLTLARVIHHYGLKADKNNRINCPFHADKTPSMQLYWKTHTAYCFSSNCQTHGKSLDVIDFIMYKENCSKHEALNKAKELATEISSSNKKTVTVVPVAQQQNNSTFNRTQFLTNLFTYFKNAVHNSKPAREYMEKRALDYTILEIGYNTGQFHHGARKDDQLIENCLHTGILSDTGGKSRTGEKAYKPFGKFCIVFALKNQGGQVCSLYFRSTTNDKEQRHFYLKERSGLYPGYPKAETEKLILTESIIDAATLLQIKEIALNYSILSLYGTNGLTKEILSAITELKELREVIIILNNDEPGREATKKVAETLKGLLPQVKISAITLPQNEDINSTYIAHSAEIFTHLIEQRNFFFSSGEPPQAIILSTEKEKSPYKKQVEQPQTTNVETEKLDTKNPYKITYKTETAIYYIQGGISKALDNMKITLMVEDPATGQKSRNKVDLYEDKQAEKLCKDVSEKLNVRKDLLEKDLYTLTELLDDYRNEQLNQEENKNSENNPDAIKNLLTPQEKQKLEVFLKEVDLLNRLNKLLGKAGITGEEHNRIFLLLIAMSFKMPEPLHALIQGSSGSGKTRLLKQVIACMPKEKVTCLTRISDKSLYNYPSHFFKNHLLCLEDIDGLSEEAEFAFRELQSNGEITSSTSIKLDNGQITAGQRTVKGPIASICCTTKGEIYEDNMGRVFLIAVNESEEQTQKIIEYQNQRAAGGIDKDKEKKVAAFIQNVVRELKPMEVINPYANEIRLPKEAHKIRRLNDLFQSFIKQITLLHQYQRKRDERGRLLTDTEDIKTAITVMFDSIVLKVDELDGSLRQFYEKLKAYVLKKGKNYEFSRFEVKEITGLGKTQQHFYLSKLTELEYVQQYGFANRGFKYKIVYWDDYTALKERIKKDLDKQVEALAFSKARTPNRTPAVAV
ncbi:MAG: CHC2 zinc finger domain-containing protein [Bacteroidota bacterium]